MAFWSAWFQTPCDKCGEKFDKEALQDFTYKSEPFKVCSDCHDEFVAEERAAEEERATRIAAEEAARAALLDRPIDTSGKAFGASGTGGGSDVF